MRRLAAACAALAAVALATAPHASAVEQPFAQPTVVSAVPSTATPAIADGVVYAITSVGSTVIVGGSFTTVRNPGSSTAITRTKLLAYDQATGTVSTAFAPVLDNTVESLLPGPLPNTVYVGGLFKTVNGVKSKGVTLLDLTTGAIVAGFKPAILNGAVYTMASTPTELLLGGSFTLAGASTRMGLASLNPTTGALDGFLTANVDGHHNYDPTDPRSVSGAIGPRAMALNPAGTELVVIGNFTTVDGQSHDQIVHVDTSGATAQVLPWTTTKYTGRCAYWRDDTYMTDVQFSPDGTYYVVTATGTVGTDVDGTKALCDSAARWDGEATLPSWVDWTGQDTLLSVAVTGTAVYVGGHQRWLNNPQGPNVASAGAVPRPGLAALDPASGVPLTWNPGRNPRGAGAYALYADATGLYVGSDQDYFGNFYYQRPKLGFFPLAGGAAAAPTTTAALPSNMYLAGTTSAPDDLAYRAMSSTDIGATTPVPGTGIAWSQTRGAFVVGDTLFYGYNGQLYRAPMGSWTPTMINAYLDPAWVNVSTGSGQTYKGVVPGYYAELPSVTGAFYEGGRLFYTLAGKSSLYWRWFSPDSGIVGGDEFTITTADFSTVNGITADGATLY